MGTNKAAEAPHPPSDISSAGGYLGRKKRSSHRTHKGLSQNNGGTVIGSTDPLRTAIISETIKIYSDN